MFGITHKLNDPSLYLLHDIAEGQLFRAEENLALCTLDQVEKITLLKDQIANYKNEIAEFEKEVANLKNEMFQFSLEELYSMYGQFENRFVGIEFHKLSDSAKKFGRNIGGIIVYKKSEREELDKIINSGNISRTDGLVKMEVTSNYNMSKEQYDELLNNGFNCRDIYQISSSNIPVQKSFKIEGLKEIPHTLNINIDPTGIEPLKIFMGLCTRRIKMGKKLIHNEWCKLYGYLLYYEPEIIKSESITKKFIDKNGNKDRKVRFYELFAKLFNKDFKKEEVLEFGDLLLERSENRIEIIKDEIKKSMNISTDEFSKKHPIIWESIRSSAAIFEEESLEYLETIIPIYWDFRGYLHIYLRHCEELQIEGHFENKTKFQYNQKDIRNVLEIAIRKLYKSINARLSSGKDFRIYGDQSLYFNGNYYALRIEPDGRIDSFFPYEIK
ncbi:MAG: hypothetical protein WCQ95_00850 [Bacteroidota bacterium]